MFLVVFWRLRYKLSLRDLAEMFLIRGFVFTHEAVRDWEAKLACHRRQQLRPHSHLSLITCAGSAVTVHVPPGRMQPIDSPMIFKGLAWRGGLPSDSVCDSLGTWNPKTNLT